MEKDIGRIKKNATTEIVVRMDEYNGKKGLTVREFVTGERYTGFTKAGTRIPAENFFQFRDLINSIDYNEFLGASGEKGKEKKVEEKKEGKEEAKPKKEKKKKDEPIVEKKSEETVVNEEELAAE